MIDSFSQVTLELQQIVNFLNKPLEEQQMVKNIKYKNHNFQVYFILISFNYNCKSLFLINKETTVNLCFVLWKLNLYRPNLGIAKIVLLIK